VRQGFGQQPTGKLPILTNRPSHRLHPDPHDARFSPRPRPVGTKPSGGLNEPGECPGGLVGRRGPTPADANGEQVRDAGTRFSHYRLAPRNRFEDAHSVPVVASRPPFLPSRHAIPLQLHSSTCPR
jgi:hypothetical protein